MSQRKTLKKFALLLVSVLSIFILAACSTGNKTPYGNIKADTIYLETSAGKITQKELYDILRYNANDHLLKALDEKVLAAELSKIDFTVNKDRVAVEKTVNSAIYGLTDIAAIAKLSDVSRARSVIKYIDNLVLTDPSLISRKDALITNLNDVITNAITTYDALSDDEKNDLTEFTFGYADETLNLYKLSYAQRQYASAKLAQLQIDEKDKSKKDDNFITDESLVAKYNSDYKGKFETVSALIVKFDNEKESEIARYKQGIKSNSAGDWYKLPDVQDSSKLALLLDESNTDANAVETRKVIKDNKIKIETGKGLNFASSEYATFYSRYTIKSETATKLENNEVLAAFLTIYNELNPEQLPTTEADLKEKVTFKYTDSVFTSTQLRTAVAALKASKDTPEEGKTAVNPYSKSVSTYDGNRYLIYFLDINEQTDILIEDPNDEDKEIFNDTEAASKIKEEIREAIFESKLTDSYIQTQLENLYKDAKINIYDKTIRTLFNFSSSLEAKGGFKDNETLATLSLKKDDETIEVNITVDALYAELEKVYGLSSAADALLSKALRAKYSVTAEKRKELETTFKSVLDNFATDGLSSSGYPKSMGKDAFLMVAFNATTNKEAFENQYILGNLRTQFTEDLEGKYANASDIYKKFAYFAEKAYTNNEGVSASHLLVSIDYNNDGTLDDPATIPADIKAKLDVKDTNGRDQVTQLTELVIELAKTRYSNVTTGIQSLVTLYNNSTRYDLLTDKLDYEIVNKFVNFRRLGLELKYESLSTISNETNFPTASSQLDSTFYEYVMDIVVEEANKQDSDSAFPLVFDTPRTINDAEPSLKGLETAFGWHTLIATGKYEAKSAEESSESYVSTFKEPGTDVALNAKNENKYLSWQQIAIYLNESNEPTGVENLPSSVNTAISTYFTPVYNKFIATNTASYISLKTVFGNDLTISNNAALQTRLDALMTVNQNQFFAYSIFDESLTNPLYTTASKGNESFKAVYGEWFTKF